MPRMQYPRRMFGDDLGKCIDKIINRLPVDQGKLLRSTRLRAVITQRLIDSGEYGLAWACHSSAKKDKIVADLLAQKGERTVIESVKQEIRQKIYSQKDRPDPAELLLAALVPAVIAVAYFAFVGLVAAGVITLTSPLFACAFVFVLPVALLALATSVFYLSKASAYAEPPITEDDKNAIFDALDALSVVAEEVIGKDDSFQAGQGV